MANNFAAQPFLIDTAMVASWRNTAIFASGPLPSAHPLHPRQVYWYNPAVIGDTFVITDPTASNIVRLEGRCEVDNQSQWFPLPGNTLWPDFIVGTLSSGTLFVYYSC